MNKNEIEEWLKTAKYHSSAVEYSENNRFAKVIYYKDGRLYCLYYCNDTITEEWGSKGYVRGSYLPIEVKEVKKTIEVVEYEPISPEV
jgi:hypothetical protein